MLFRLSSRMTTDVMEQVAASQSWGEQQANLSSLYNITDTRSSTDGGPMTQLDFLNWELRSTTITLRSLHFSARHHLHTQLRCFGVFGYDSFSHTLTLYVFLCPLVVSAMFCQLLLREQHAVHVHQHQL